MTIGGGNVDIEFTFYDDKRKLLLVLISCIILDSQKFELSVVFKIFLSDWECKIYYLSEN